MGTRGCKGLRKFGAFSSRKVLALEGRAAPLEVEEQAQALRVLREHVLVDADARKLQAERLGLDVVRLLGEYRDVPSIAAPCQG